MRASASLQVNSPTEAAATVETAEAARMHRGSAMESSRASAKSGSASTNAGYRMIVESMPNRRGPRSIKVMIAVQSGIIRRSPHE